MGGLPKKPKIQAYVGQKFFDRFEDYRSSYGLNQSKALERLLAEFFGESVPNQQVLIDLTLIQELVSKVELLGQRLNTIESRLEAESIRESAKALARRSSEAIIKPLAESAPESAGAELEDESAPESASESAGAELDQKQLAERLQISTRTLQRWLAQGEAYFEDSVTKKDPDGLKWDLSEDRKHFRPVDRGVA